MYQIIFNQALHGRGEARRWGRRLRRLILKWTDPVVSWELNGRKLRLPLSHELPFYRQQLPTYSANLERLAAALRKAHGKLVMIDVGANIGDSVALVGAGPRDACLLLEGDPRYFALLEANTAELPGAVCVSVMLSDQSGPAAVRLITKSGTGHVVSGGGALESSVTTLDRVVQEHPEFSCCHLLKIDVDGYDFRVMRGAAELIQQAQPVLFFEQHPGLLAQAQEDPDGVWPWLVQAGYTSLFVYDNAGFLVGTFAAADTTLLRQLNDYARQRKGPYYDVAAFTARHQQLRDTFAAGERAFYGSRQPGPTTA